MTETENTQELQTKEPATTELQTKEQAAPELLYSFDGEDVSQFTRKRSKKKWIILGILLLIVVGILGYVLLMPKPIGVPISVMPLAKTDLVNQISLSGTVESADSASVYSSLASQVQTVHVKVGDVVQAGDLLAEFDTADLQLSIAKQQALMKQDALLNQHTIETSQKALDNAAGNAQSGLDSQLLAAESSLRNAQQELNDARSEYNDASDVHTSADDDLTAAEKAYYKAESARDDAEQNLKRLTDAGAPVDEIQAAEEKLKEAETAYKLARNDVTNAEGAVDELSRERRLYRSARVAYENALAHKRSVENANSQELDSYRDNITKSEITADQTVSQLELKRLQNDLADSTLTAPISGMVTAVYAKEGEPAKGLMFVIEDTDALVVKTTVKEYDIATVKEGMKTEVKSDATGEEVFDGKVQKIYPTAVKEADGSTKSSGSVEFEADVSLLDQDQPLRVGMNVRLNVITGEKQEVYAVPFDAVKTLPDGRSVVYTTETNEEGQLIAKAIVVTTGMETDFSLEISSPQLTDGMSIISSLPEGLINKSPVLITPERGAPALGSASVVEEIIDGDLPASSASASAPASSSAPEAASSASSEGAPGAVKVG